MYHDETGCKQASCGCLKTAKDLRGETRIPPFRSIVRVTKWVVRLIIVTIIVSIISIVADNLYFAIASYPLEDDSLIDNITTHIGTFLSIISILTMIIGLFWYYRASRNIHSFGAKQVWRPILSVIWWFIPPLNLYLPYDVTQQLWKVSNPQTKLVNGTEWKETSSSNMIKLWWILTLVSVFFGLGLGVDVNQRYGDTDPDAISEAALESVETRLFAIITSTSFSMLYVISDIYLIKIIRQISKWQELKQSNPLSSTSV